MTTFGTFSRTSAGRAARVSEVGKHGRGDSLVALHTGASEEEALVAARKALLAMRA
ncbi:hypothetical protein ACFQVD_34640 [Streptosporangium amethystogenes subsp. fukuiense]|uniref:Uncharacterized protein n=1 Tax=Streptosporangium amethystogenes subsp. fukuiense TaxID=698418 RepID=A0ABW2TBR1_9ACTN